MTNPQLGVESTQLNQQIIVVRKQGSLTLSNIFEPLSNIYDFENISPHSNALEGSFYLAAYRVDDNDWILVQQFGNITGNVSLQELAKEFSDRASTFVYVFEQSDTGLFSRYSIWQEGFLTERFEFYEEGIYAENGESLSGFEEQPIISRLLVVSDDVVEDYGGSLPYQHNCVLYSTSIRLSNNDLCNPYQFISDKFSDVGAYIPDIAWEINSSKKLINSFFSNAVGPENFQEIAFARVNQINVSISGSAL